MSKRIDLVGKKFGKLTVIRATRLVLSRVRNTYKEYRQEYECLCDCGNIKLTTCSQLKSALKGKGTSSCGCAMRKDDNEDHWSVSFNMIWKSYVCTAKNHNRNFTLTKPQFNELISDNCFYCGSVPYAVRKSKSKRFPDETIYNGIDRVDNNVGYVLKNCVTCCETCNRMKLALGQRAFLNHVEKIYNYSIM